MDLSRCNNRTFNIDIINNNIYNWKILFKNFNNPKLEESLIELNGKFKYDYIEVDIYLHGKLYPNYPPVVKVMRPNLEDSLMHKIANTKMIQLNYWDPTRTMSFVVNKIHKMLEKHAKINANSELNDKNKYLHGAFSPIEDHLLDLASHTDDVVDESYEIDDEKYEKLFDKKEVTNNNKVNNSKTIWGSGTGYGSGHANTWNIADYIKSLEERDNQTLKILNKIVNEIQKCQDVKTIYNTIENSILIKYISSLLDGTTFLEMRKHLELYKTCFNLLGNLISEDSIKIFENHGGNKKSLYELLVELNMQSIASKKISKEQDELTDTITTLFTIVEQCHEKYVEKENLIIKEKVEEKQQESDKEKYVRAITELRDDDNECKLVNTNYYYQKDIDSNRTFKTKSATIKRIFDEVLSFSSLPIFYDALIISRADGIFSNAIRTLITGPIDTPYECGCFIFDTYLDSNFPQGAPKVWFLNTGNKRMNPNLYDSGKVCLSILGTWSGQAGEEWNSEISTLSQVYKSIQSQILVEQPYYNEPGHETRESKKISDSYNDNIKLYTMSHCMLDLIKNPKSYPQFEDVIRLHFRMKKDKILSVCDKWTKDAPSNMKNEYKKVYDEIKIHIEKI